MRPGSVGRSARNLCAPLVSAPTPLSETTPVVPKAWRANKSTFVAKLQNSNDINIFQCPDLSPRDAIAFVCSALFPSGSQLKVP
jgi:hypothetical protein